MKRLKDQKVVEGQSVEFVCELSKPDYKVTWMQSDVIIPLDDQRFRQEVDGTSYKLIIPESSLDMNADYSIVAGDNQSTGTLYVTGRCGFTNIADSDWLEHLVALNVSSHRLRGISLMAQLLKSVTINQCHLELNPFFVSSCQFRTAFSFMILVDLLCCQVSFGFYMMLC